MSRFIGLEKGHPFKMLIITRKLTLRKSTEKNPRKSLQSCESAKGIQYFFLPKQGLWWKKSCQNLTMSARFYSPDSSFQEVRKWMPTNESNCSPTGKFIAEIVKSEKIFCQNTDKNIVKFLFVICKYLRRGFDLS